VGWIYVGSGIVTAISRLWAPGDAARCRRCVRCSATSDVCLIQVNGYVKREDAALYSTRHLNRQTFEPPTR
jgi:hypothetical protein